jgi:hypothetical protein
VGQGVCAAVARSHLPLGSAGVSTFAVPDVGYSRFRERWFAVRSDKRVNGPSASCAAEGPFRVQHHRVSRGEERVGGCRPAPAPWEASPSFRLGVGAGAAVAWAVSRPGSRSSRPHISPPVMAADHERAPTVMQAAFARGTVRQIRVTATDN